MPVTPKELDDFTRFAAERLSHGDSVPSLEECLRQWRADGEFQETVADVRQSLDDCANGRVKPLDQAFDDVRRILDSPHDPRSPSGVVLNSEFKI